MLVLACGALVSELRAVLEAAGLSGRVEVHFLPASLHNRPERIVPELTSLLDRLGRSGTREVLIAYGDCGTGGDLDRLLATRPTARRLPGAHCYEFFAGPDLFAALAEDEPGTFYLTDFLALHFVALVWQGLGIDRHPELRDMLFAHYRKVVLLKQSQDDAVDVAAEHAAQLLSLPLQVRRVGLGPFVAATELSAPVPVHVRLRASRHRDP